MKNLFSLLTDNLKDNAIIKITSITMLALFLFPPYVVEVGHVHKILSAGRCFVLATPTYHTKYGDVIYGNINSIDMIAQVFAVGAIGLLLNRYLKK